MFLHRDHRKDVVHFSPDSNNILATRDEIFNLVLHYFFFTLKHFCPSIIMKFFVYSISINNEKGCSQPASSILFSPLDAILCRAYLEDMRLEAVVAQPFFS